MYCNNTQDTEYQQHFSKLFLLDTINLKHKFIFLLFTKFKSLMPIERSSISYIRVKHELRKCHRIFKRSDTVYKEISNLFGF